MVGPEVPGVEEVGTVAVVREEREEEVGEGGEGVWVERDWRWALLRRESVYDFGSW